MRHSFWIFCGPTRRVLRRAIPCVCCAASHAPHPPVAPVSSLVSPPGPGTARTGREAAGRTKLSPGTSGPVPGLPGIPRGTPGAPPSAESGPHLRRSRRTAARPWLYPDWTSPFLHCRGCAAPFLAHKQSRMRDASPCWAGAWFVHALTFWRQVRQAGLTRTGSRRMLVVSDVSEDDGGRETGDE